MKKLMKALAFVTVMCLALSTVAFAAGTAELGDAEKVLDITVTGAGNDQVALVVVAADAEDLSAPLYIDQVAAVDGTADFTAVLTNAEVDAVDIYVGYATYADANAAPEKLANDVAITNPITEVTIQKIDTEIVSAEGLQQVGAAVAITFSVEAPEGVYATEMIWAIRYQDGEDVKVKYTEPMAVADYEIGTKLTGNVTLGLAFLNGFNVVGEEIASLNIVDVDVILVFANNEVELTNAADAANELK